MQITIVNFGQNIKRKKITINYRHQRVIKSVQKLEQSIPVKAIAVINFFIFCEFFPEGKPQLVFCTFCVNI